MEDKDVIESWKQRTTGSQQLLIAYISHSQSTVGLTEYPVSKHATTASHPPDSCFGCSLVPDDVERRWTR